MRLPPVLAASAIVAASWGVVSAVDARSAAQSSPSSPPQSTFRAGVDVVRVEVAALDERRRPVLGLTASDFTVVDDGNRRPIVAFAEVHVPSAPPPAPAAARWTDEVAHDVSVNQAQDLRRIVIVMDDAMTRSGPRVAAMAKAIARGIIDRLGPGDQAAVVFTMFGGSAQSFTSDRARLLRAVEGFQPRYSSQHELTDVDFVAAYTSARTLSNVADAMMASRDRRKIIAFISPGAPIDQVHPPAAIAGNGDADLAFRELRELQRRAARANVTIYGFDPTGLDGVDQGVLQVDVAIKTPATAGGMRPPASVVAAVLHERARLQRDLLIATAEGTGGTAISGTDNLEPALTAMFDEVSAHYLIGFTPAPGASGRERRLQIRTLRPGVTIHAANTYMPPESAVPAAGDTRGDSDLERVLRASTPAEGISLHLATAVFRPSSANAAKTAANTVKIALVLGVELPLGDAGPATTHRAELLARAYGSQGEARGSRSVVVDLALRRTSAAQTYYEVMTDLELPPGRYEMRAALHEPRLGRTGSVFHHIEVPDFARVPLSLSDIVLSTVPSLRAGPANAFLGLIPVQPTSSREFPKTIAVRAFARLYRSASQAAAGGVTVRSTITSALGRVVLDTTESIEAARLDARGSSDLLVPVPVKDFDPGEYLLTMEASAQQARAERAVRFSVVR